jgi:hypothetical protein
MTLFVAVVAWFAISNNQRWQSMLDKVQVGLTQNDPLRVLCDGLSVEDKARIRQTYINRDTDYVDDLIQSLEVSDGARILLMRAGLTLVYENPQGQDGGRGSFKKLIEQKCGHEPKLTFAHLHQSWMDLALGIGWLGAAIFALVLLYFIRKGWRGLAQPETAFLSMSLVLISGFWFFRGFADSLYREHYLQMQALLLAYIYGHIELARRTPENNLRTLKDKS